MCVLSSLDQMALEEKQTTSEHRWKNLDWMCLDCRKREVRQAWHRLTMSSGCQVEPRMDSMESNSGLTLGSPLVFAEEKRKSSRRNICRPSMRIQEDCWYVWFTQHMNVFLQSYTPHKVDALCKREKHGGLRLNNSSISIMDHFLCTSWWMQMQRLGRVCCPLSMSVMTAYQQILSFSESSCKSMAYASPAPQGSIRDHMQHGLLSMDSQSTELIMSPSPRRTCRTAHCHKSWRSWILGTRQLITVLWRCSLLGMVRLTLHTVKVLTLHLPGVMTGQPLSTEDIR